MENKNETSRIINTAKLLGEGALMVDSTSGPRLEVTEAEFNDAQAEMEADLGAQEAVTSEHLSDESRLYWEKLVEKKMDEVRELENAASRISELIDGRITPEEIRDHFFAASDELEARAQEIIDRKGLNIKTRG